MVRCDTENNYKNSTPCNNCLNIIKGLNIKRIVFSSGENEFTSCRPCEIDINHTSAGSKFLNKRT